MAIDPVLVANTAAWIKKAHSDLARVDRCMTAQPPDVEDAVFHCQQSVEKSLKAFLTWHDEPFRKTHDLSTLATQCGAFDNTLDPLLSRADDLSEYAWAYRYPTSSPTPAPSEAEEARTVAAGIFAEVTRRLPVEVLDAAGLKCI
jgi:HEPN domain-containing protein